MANTPQVKNISGFQAFLQCKCPRCRQGNIFTGPAYGFKLQRTNKACPHCGLIFEREPGYYYVAMYVGYAFVVAELVSICVAMSVVGVPFDFESIWWYLGAMFLGSLLFAPFNYRYSRAVLLHYLTPAFRFDERYALGIKEDPGRPKE